MSKRGDSYKHYTEVTYSGCRLLEKHKLDETRTWHIKGEDPNCDWGGSHHQPDLGYFTGTLNDCIKYAISLPNFWTWGGGGSILASEPVMASPKLEAVAEFITNGVREKALAKLTTEEIEALGLNK